MKTLIAFCGLSCKSCTNHLATLEKDPDRQKEMKASIVEEIARLYGMNLKTEDIKDCDGCRAKTGRLFSGCASCGIRRCAINRNIESCAYCADYPCEQLNHQFLQYPSSRSRLEEMRQTINI